MTDTEKKIGYRFKNKALLDNALTHSSYANEKKCESNERLEFLGDSVLSVIVSKYLYKRLPEMREGDLSKLRASLVCEQSLDVFARRIGLDKALKLGHGEEIGGGRRRPSIVSDAFEAVLAAIYLDSDIYAATEWLFANIKNDIEDAINGNHVEDYKTKLQEILQKRNNVEITYEIINEEGQDHLKTFTATVKAGNKLLGTGQGHSKKEAEQHAAKMAIGKIR